MKPTETIELFDAFLSDRGLVLDAVVVGGAALGLLGVISRQTKDCDILHPELSPEILTAARDFAAARRLNVDHLADDWLNNGPASLADVLPEGWRTRLRTVFDGHAVHLRVPGRMDLLRSKLFALCDRGIDEADCLALSPTHEELKAIAPWLEERDGNPGWPAHTRQVLTHLEEKLHHGV